MPTTDRDRIPAGASLKTRKKVKINHSPSTVHLQSLPHPLGVKPLGNRLFDPTPCIRSPGLGSFNVLSDEFILSFLGSELDDVSLCRLAQAAKALYCFVYTEELWRERLKSQTTIMPRFKGNWRKTYISFKNISSSLDSTTAQSNLVVKGMYSDYLHTSWQCRSIPLEDLCRTSAPDTQIPRFSSMSLQDFTTTHSKAPFVLTGFASQWPAMTKWNMDLFRASFPSKLLKAEAFEATFENYQIYAKQCQEESPLYLFDKGFADDSTLSQDYTIPDIFEDYFSLLAAHRPDYRWLIIGPARSGSTFHIDPNGTSAWNAVLKGSKKWILYPPSTPPPGVFPSSDGSEVTSPVSLAEWYLHYYSEMTHGPVQPVEVICKAGEIMFVPSGWWHSVMNLEDDTIAITQNFVSEHNLDYVLGFLKNRACQISGVERADGLYERFVGALREVKPEVLERTLRKMDDDKKQRQEAQVVKQSVSMGDLFSTGLSHSIDEAQASGFAFSF